MKNIFILIPEISQGGAQIQSIRAANALAVSTSNRITLVVIKPIQQKYRSIIQKKHPLVSLIVLNKPPGLFNTL